MNKKKNEDPVAVERRAIREAGQRRLQGEVTTDEISLAVRAGRIVRTGRRRFSKFEDRLAFNPCIRPTGKP